MRSVQYCELTEESFSSPLLGKAYGQLKDRYRQGLEVSLGALTDLTAEEMSHLAGITHRHQGTVNADAFRDCVNTVLAQHQSAGVSNDDDLMALRNQLKERKGTRA